MIFPWLIDPIFWNWLILGALLLLLEALSASFFFMFWATAAFILTALTYFYPTMSWQWQLINFALLSLPALLAWRSVAKKWQKDPNDTASKLNNRGRDLIGRQFTLQTPITQNYGHLQINDTFWIIHGEDLPAGSTVIITDLNSSTLEVRRVD